MLTKETIAEITKQYGRKAGDTGSVEVQVALLTAQINALTDHMKANKKDHSSNRGLLKMVGRRKQLLEYLAQPEIAAQIVKIDGGIPALTDTQVESGTDAAYTADAFKEAQTAFDGDLYYDNFFDREYLPSGMWSVMTDSIDTLLANEDPASDKEAAIAIVQDNYDDLMGN